VEPLAPIIMNVLAVFAQLQPAADWGGFWQCFGKAPINVGRGNIPGVTGIPCPAEMVARTFRHLLNQKKPWKALSVGQRRIFRLMAVNPDPNHTAALPPVPLCGRVGTPAQSLLVSSQQRLNPSFTLGRPWASRRCRAPCRQSTEGMTSFECSVQHGRQVAHWRL